MPQWIFRQLLHMYLSFIYSKSTALISFTLDVIDDSKCRRLILGNCSLEAMSGSGPLQPDGPHGPGGQLYQ
jgi:hypothetical protein